VSAGASPASSTACAIEVIDTWHRVDWLAAVEAVGDEHRVDEVRRVQVRLANEAAKSVRGAQPAKAGLRERHQFQDNGGAGAATPRSSAQPGAL
jgi:hypothetical protein